MKILVFISRIFVAALFLFSGFIKLNDPLGFSYKLQEYFSEGVLNLEFLIPIALVLAVFIVVFEVILGIALILGYLPKFTDALPLTPWESFTKDVILLVLILVLFFGRKYITPILPVSSHKWIVFVGFTACLIFAYHVLMHLPVFDFRAYKKGINIQQGMEVPEDAPKAVFDYRWKFDVNGEEKIITTSGDYPSVEGGKYIGVETEVVEEGYLPPIHDFSIEKEGNDYTSIFLEREHLVVIVMYNLSKSEAEGMTKMNNLATKAKSQGYDVIALTASLPSDIAKAKQRFNLDVDFYETDETALKTILRSNPGIIKLNKGTIIEKLHWNDAEDLPLEKVDRAAPIRIETPVLEQLDTISVGQDSIRVEQDSTRVDTIK